MGVEQGPKPFKQSTITLVLQPTDGFQPEVDRGKNVIEVGTQATEPQRFTIEDIITAVTTALDLPITPKNLALVRARYYGAIRKDPSIESYRIKEEGRQGKPRVFLTKENFEKVVRAIREQKGRRTKEKRIGVEQSAEGDQIGTTVKRPNLQKPKIDLGDWQDDVERTEEGDRVGAKELDSRTRRKLKLNLTRTILSHLTANELAMFGKNIEKLMVACLPSGVSLDTVIGSNLDKDSRGLLIIGLFIETLEEFWGVTKIDQVTAEEKKIVEGMILLKRHGYDVKSTVGIVGRHFSIQIPDEYKDERVGSGVIREDPNIDGNRPQRRVHGSNWDRLGHQQG